MTIDGVARTRLDKAAEDGGFGVPDSGASTDAWRLYRAHGVSARLLLGVAAGGGYLIGVDHGGAAAELSAERATEVDIDPAAPPPPGFALFRTGDSGELQRLVNQVWAMARSLPDAPLQRFQARVQALTLPSETEIRREVTQRIGQDVFREALIDFWGGACAVTGVENQRLLRASHIKPWASSDDEERLNVYNGLLLAAHLDAAFDAGLMTFDADGASRLSPALAPGDAERLGLSPALRLRAISPEHEGFLVFHRAEVFQFDAAPG